MKNQKPKSCKRKNRKPKNCKMKNQKPKNCKTKNRRAIPSYFAISDESHNCPVSCRTCCCQGVSHALLVFVDFLRRKWQIIKATFVVTSNAKCLLSSLMSANKKIVNSVPLLTCAQEGQQYSAHLFEILACL